MTSQSRTLLLLAATVLLSADLSLAQSRERRGDGPERSTPTTQPAYAVERSNRPPSMEDEFKVLLERSIFAKSGSAARVGGPPATSTAPAAPPLSPEQIVVFVGVLAQDDEYLAFAENQQTRQLMILRTGDDVARGKVVAITLDSIAYGVGGNIKEIHLGQNLAGELASTSFASGAGAPPTTGPAGAAPATGAPSRPLSAVEEAMRQRRLRGE
jgi:hypothetical protein